MGADWFSTWFNSHYYHLLYSNRDQNEANRFIDNLLSKLSPNQTDKILDLACGKGRHSIYLNKKGYNVTGVDLSEESIRYAKQFENENLKFKTGDMREPLDERFYYIFNLFTSFGYFENKEDDLKTLGAVKTMLKEGGTFILDFFNTEKVVKNLVSSETKTEGGIEFQLSRKVENGKIIKDIRFRDNGQNYHFSEQVSAIYKNTFLEYFDKIGFEIINIWGSYDLDDYDPANSDRMVFHLRNS